MSATLTGFGGIGEIGGNAFLLDDGKGRLLLDIGKRFGNDTLVEELGLRPGWNDFYDEFNRPRTFRLIPDLLALGLVPHIPGLYRQDLGGDTNPDPIEGVLISHAHQDHYGLLGLLRPSIPIIGSTDTRAILQSIQATGQSSPENDLVRTKSRGNVGRKKDGSLTTTPKTAPGPERRFGSHAVGDWNVEVHGVDHSIQGAIGAVVSAPGFSLAYTGDYRFHGRNGAATEKFIERAQGVDYLLTEGTRVRRPSDREAKHAETDKEVDVEGQILDHVVQADRDGKAFVGIGFPPRDLDRFISVYNVARKVGRKLAIPTKLAHLLDTLRTAGRTELPDPRNDSALAVHIQAKNKGVILQAPRGKVSVAKDDLTTEDAATSDDEVSRLLEGDYEEWELPYLESKTMVSSPEIGRDPTGYLMTLTYWTISELFDVFPDSARAEGTYIHSATQPFNDEMEHNDRKLNRWLTRFGLDRRDTHVSGHLDPTMLEWVIDKVAPKVLLPIHTLACEYTAERYQSRTQHRAILPEYGKAIPLA